MRHHASLQHACLALAYCIALGTADLSAPVAAWGQAAGMGGMGSSQTITVRAQVKAIDLAKREATLIGPEGNAILIHVSDAVQNLDKVKVGDTVVATYYASIALVLSAPGIKTPEDQLAAAAARAPKGQLPGGALATKTVVTGTVVGVDLEAHTISLVDPSGGLVHRVTVTDPRRQAALKQVKVGDMLTAIATEAFAISLEPA